MTMMPVLETHIYLDDKGRACVKRAGVKVREIIETLAAYKCTHEELISHFPNLKLSEVHAALSYYYDHREEIDSAIRAGNEFAAEFLAKNPESPLTKRLRSEGKIP